MSLTLSDILTILKDFGGWAVAAILVFRTEKKLELLKESQDKFNVIMSVMFKSVDPGPADVPRKIHFNGNGSEQKNPSDPEKG